MPTVTTSDSLCKTCEHAVFDVLWGEYKCKAISMTVYDGFSKTECEHYKKGTPTFRNPEPECPEE